MYFARFFFFFSPGVVFCARVLSPFYNEEENIYF